MSKRTTPDVEPPAHPRTDHGTVPNQAARSQLIPRWRTAILVGDGAFLLVAGLAALAADLVGYFSGVGPFAALAGQPLSVGAVEAHGLAALVGFLLLTTPPSDRWRWHAVAAGVHLFFGICNLLSWEVYSVMGATPAGIVSTVVHAVLFIAQLACLALPDASEQPELPGWLRGLRQSGLYVRPIAIGTLLLGAGTHVALATLGREALPRILTPGFEEVPRSAVGGGSRTTDCLPPRG